MTAKADLLSECQTMLAIAGCGDRMIGRQVPPGAIVGSVEPVLAAQVPAQHFAAIAAFEVDDGIALHRSLDRHRGNKSLVHRRVFPRDCRVIDAPLK